MADSVTDTHGLIWYLRNTLHPGTNANRLFDECDRELGIIYVPTICLVEIVYLQEKGRIPATLKALFETKLQSGKTGLRLATLTAGVVDALTQISRTDVPDMPDRINAATALALGFPLISKDRRIQSSTVATVW
jgi:PIN domain nuclease of toxin-antitoxin system